MGDRLDVLWIALAGFVVAIVVNCVAVHAQKRYRAYDRLGHRAWPAHIALLVLVWGATVVLITVLVIVGPVPSWPLPGWVRWVGLLVGVTASVIFGLGIRELGVQSLFNGNFFGRGPRHVVGGIYGLIADPMYTAYTLSFVSLALRQADAVYLLFALVSLVGLNGVEARVERVDPAPRPTAGPSRHPDAGTPGTARAPREEP